MEKLSDMMRRILSIALALVMLAGVVGIEAFADAAPPAVTEATDGSGALSPEDATLQELIDEPVLMPETEPGTESAPAPEAPSGSEPAVPPAQPETTEPVPAAEETALPPEEAAEESDEQTEEAVSDDPLYWKRMYSPMTIASIPNSFQSVTPRSLGSSEVLHKGIDVSEFQGNIAWSTVKSAGIDFAIIRAAYRGYQYGTLGADAKYAQNLKNAAAAGIKVGAYIFSQATTPEEAREEARYLVNIVKNYNIDLPLVFDYEEVSASSRRLKLAELDRQTKTDIANAFCDEVESFGYQAMVYSNLSMLYNDLYPAQMGKIWLAHWTKQTTYTGNYEYWQFGVGTVSGISNEVDLDYWFAPSGTAIPPSNGQVVTPSATPTPTPVPTPTPNPTDPATSTTPPTVNSQFTDVKSTDWFYSDITWAAGKGIVSGVGNDQFSPNGTATRAQVVTMLHRMKGQPKASTSAGFTDLTGDYYKAAVNWAVGAGIVKGTSETTFSPNGQITRGDLVTLLYRMAGTPSASGSLSSYGDGPSVKTYARMPMIWAINVGLIKGYNDNTVRANASATRAEVCTMLRRYSDLG